MADRPFKRVGVATLFLILAGTVAAGAPARAESPSDTLAYNMKVLGTSPKDFNALIGAGRAALALGDAQAAAGFFGRAEEVWPASALPQAGMGAALAQDGDGRGALQYFARAVQRGATPSMIGADRGLAYDLTGQHNLAQADYRAALSGSDRDEARRRLALSLAITGNKAEAISTLGPLVARGDAGGARCRALVLALSGDSAGARQVIDAAMPGSSSRMAYFFSRLPSLRSDQKAAAVNLGIFPAEGTRVASAGSVSSYSTPTAPQVAEDRIGSIAQWLSTANAPPAAAPQSGPTQIASVSIPRPGFQSARPAAAVVDTKHRYWVQLASGQNAAALPGQFNRIKSRAPDMMEGLKPYVAQEPNKVRLLVGPFANSSDASDFADGLESARVNAFSWTSDPGQLIRKLPTE